MIADFSIDAVDLLIVLAIVALVVIIFSGIRRFL